MEQKEQDFTRMVERNKRVIYTVCYMFSKSRQEVEDLFQEVLIKLWNGFDRFRGESDAKTWIYRVTLNCCLDQRKKWKREGVRVPLSVDIDPFEDTSDRSLQTRRLYDRINRLGLIDRAIILLWLEGMTYEEIGSVIGISVKNVSYQLFRIKEEHKKMSN